MKFSDIICPKCGNELRIEGNSLKCNSNHCFDVSSQGYVNLLPPHKQGSIPGDSKEMARARRTFLNNGYYRPIADAICDAVSRISTQKIVDIGCGEGYYTGLLKQSCDADVIGFDISKFALAYAAKAYKDVSFCVANLHALPLKDKTADALVCCFCAYDAKEFSRVLKDDGRFVFVVPGKKHLFGLKSVLYENPYENEVDTTIDGFELESANELNFTITVNGDDIQNLFAMTPYYWKTPKEGSARLLALESLDTEVNVIVCTYKKISL